MVRRTGVGSSSTRDPLPDVFLQGGNGCARRGAAADWRVSRSDRETLPWLFTCSELAILDRAEVGAEFLGNHLVIQRPWRLLVHVRLPAFARYEVCAQIQRLPPVTRIPRMTGCRVCGRSAKPARWATPAAAVSAIADMLGHELAPALPAS
jgi:hypothetical protein